MSTFISLGPLATIGAGTVVPASLSTVNTDNFVFPNDISLAGLLKWSGGTTKWQASVVGNTDLYFRDTTNNRNLLAFSTNGIVQIPASIYLDILGGAGIRAAGNTFIYIGAATVDASAVVQLDSTTQGFAPPRMTTTQKNAISSPLEGMIVYDTSLHKLCVRVAAAWETITSV